MVDVKLRSYGYAVSPIAILLLCAPHCFAASSDTEQATEIIIKATRPTKSTSIDARTYDIVTNPEALMLNAKDVIVRLPGVIRDSEGEITVLGDSSIRYLVDGEPLPDSVVLQIPATDIDQVEIVTNAGANTKGNTGITINIVTRKRHKAAYSLTNRLEIDSRERIEFNSYYIGKLGEFEHTGAIDVAAKKQHKTKVANIVLNTIAPPDNVALDNSRQDQNSSQLSLLNMLSKGDKKKNGIAFYHSYNRTYFESSEDITILAAPMGSVFGPKEKDSFENLFNSHTVGFVKSQMSRHMGKIEFSLSLDASESEQASEEQFEKNAGEDVHFLRNNNNEGNSFNVALEAKKDDFFDGVLKYGADYQANTDRLSIRYADLSLKPFQQKTKINTLSLFATYQFSTGGFKLLPGMRIEGAQLSLESLTELHENLVRHKNYTNLLPSFHLSYLWSNKDRFSASYAKKAEPLQGTQLNPAPRQISFSQREVGNWQLKPTLTDRYELSYERTRDRYSGLITAYYRVSSNYITTLSTYVAPDTYVGQYANIGSRTAQGVDFNIKFDVTKKLNLALDIHTYKTRFKDAQLPLLSKDQDLNTDYKFNLLYLHSETEDISLLVEYVDKSIDFERINSGKLTSSITYTKKLNQNFSFNIDLINIGGSSVQKNLIETSTYRSYSRTKPEMTGLRFGLSKRY